MFACRSLEPGPPGTGKSYLGVVMVRALLIIRKYWVQVRLCSNGELGISTIIDTFDRFNRLLVEGMHSHLVLAFEEQTATLIRINITLSH